MNNNQQGSLAQPNSNAAGLVEQMTLDKLKVTPKWSTRLSRLMENDSMQDILANYSDVQQAFKETQVAKGLDTVKEGFIAEKKHYGNLLEAIIEMEYHFGYVQKNASMVIKNGVRKFTSVVEQLVLIKEQQTKAVFAIHEALLKEMNGKGSLKRPRPVSSPESSPGNGGNSGKKMNEVTQSNEELSEFDQGIQNVELSITEKNRKELQGQRKRKKVLQEEENRKRLQEQREKLQQQQKRQKDLREKRLLEERKNQEGLDKSKPNATASDRSSTDHHDPVKLTNRPEVSESPMETQISEEDQDSLREQDNSRKQNNTNGPKRISKAEKKGGRNKKSCSFNRETR